MKKVLVATAGAALLLSGTASSASATPAPLYVEVSTRTPDKVEIRQQIDTRVKAIHDRQRQGDLHGQHHDGGQE